MTKCYSSSNNYAYTLFFAAAKVCNLFFQDSFFKISRLCRAKNHYLLVFWQYNKAVYFWWWFVKFHLFHTRVCNYLIKSEQKNMVGKCEYGLRLSVERFDMSFICIFKEICNSVCLVCFVLLKCRANFTPMLRANVNHVASRKCFVPT